MASCSKIILFGEHSVVYGKKAIAIPFFKQKLEIEFTKDDIYQTKHLEYIKSLMDIKDNIRVKTNIPYSRGLGYSAALAVEIANRMNCKNIEKIVELSEMYAHGNASGIDAKVIIEKKPIIFQKNEKIQYIDINIGAYLVVIDTNICGETKKAVEQVKNKNRYDLIEKLANITQKAIEAINSKNTYYIANLMNESEKILEQFDLVDEYIKSIIKITRYNSMGAKITGAGLGGCIIALCKKKTDIDKIKRNLKKKGVNNIWYMKI